MTPNENFAALSAVICDGWGYVVFDKNEDEEGVCAKLFYLTSREIDPLIEAIQVEGVEDGVGLSRYKAYEDLIRNMKYFVMQKRRLIQKNSEAKQAESDLLDSQRREASKVSMKLSEEAFALGRLLENISI